MRLEKASCIIPCLQCVQESTCTRAFTTRKGGYKLNLRILLFAVLLLALAGACGDGPDKPGGITPPARLPVISTPAPNQQGGALAVPCDLNEFVEITPNLPYDVTVTNDDHGLKSLKGVLMDVCMGAVGQDKKTTTETLGKGIQAWLESHYPKGSTEKSQADFEAKVCEEVSRLMTSDSSLRRISWVSLATTGTFSLDVMPVTGTIPPPKPSGNYTDPGCKLPKIGPTA